MNKLIMGTWLMGFTGLTMAAVMVGHFSAGDLEDWNTKSFTGETRYRLVEKDGRQVLRADSRGTASGLYREITVDLIKTPYLNWSWRVANVLQDIDERTKVGDDYPARIYAVISGGVLFWKTYSLVYVWSSHQPVGSTWPSAYTDNARLMALRSGENKMGNWVNEKRNLRLDFKDLFGEEVERIDAIALMTDTDDSGQAATAWYGNIYFLAD